MSYIPPFTISTKAINLIAEISGQIERYAIHLEQEDTLLLRKVNRIKTIQGSLAIEGNRLTEGQITDIVDGKHVVAPIREIQEVRNAIRTYDAYSSLNPFLMRDLQKAHKLMMEALVDDAGCFRKGGVGVFAGNEVIHVAPPADRVPTLLHDLFEWLEHSEDHLLIKSSVFHYEFEFIHPFSDGNGRIGRLWQSLLLGKLHPLFEHLPIENMVFANQQGYYSAINRSSKNTDCGVFIDFMLQEILHALKMRQGEALIKNVGVNVGVNVGENEGGILAMIHLNNRISVKSIAEQLHLSTRQVERILTGLKKKGYLNRIGGAKGGHWELSGNFLSL